MKIKTMMQKVVLFFWVCFMPVATIAADGSPVDMLQTTSNQMIEVLKADQSKIKSDPTFVYTLAREILLPHVDVQAMARLALGRDAWQSATPAQRQQFIDEFTELMLRTYGTAMASYTNQTVQFKPVRGGVGDSDRIQVDSLIVQQGAPSIPVSYRLRLTEGKAWKVYDISVDNVSMVQSFRSQFANEIAQGGMSGLLTAMTQHRKQS